MATSSPAPSRATGTPALASRSEAASAGPGTRSTPAKDGASTHTTATSRRTERMASRRAARSGFSAAVTTYSRAASIASAAPVAPSVSRSIVDSGWVASARTAASAARAVPQSPPPARIRIRRRVWPCITSEQRWPPSTILFSSDAAART